MGSLVPSEQSRYNAGDALLKRAATRARLLRCESRDCGGQELATRTLEVQHSLETLGLRGGDRVLLALRDTPAFYAAFLGAMRGGLVPVPVSTLLPPKDLAFIARDAGVRAALLDSALPAAARDPSLYPADTALVRVDGWEGDKRDLGSSREPTAAETRAADPAFWLYTSGTTGEPKGVVHRHIDLPATAEGFGSILQMNPGDRVLSAPKLFFAYGLGNSLTFPLFFGAEVVLHPGRPTPESMFELLRSEAPTLFFGVPTLYSAMLAHSELPDSLGRVRLCVSAGEALAPALYERWRERFGVEILDALGTTEMLHCFLANQPGAVRPGSSGKPVPGYEVRIVDDAGADLADGEIGTLLVKGVSGARAYHDRSEQTARTMLPGNWLRTGDSYRRDTAGFYYHMGRSDDLIKVSGQFVSPVEVEAALLAHPGVMEAAVVAHSDEYGLLKPKAYVVPKSEARAHETLARELQSFVKESIAPHKYPRWIEFVDELPKTATGKIQRYLLREEPA